MHIPDGLLSPRVLVACSILAVITISWSLRQTKATLGERQVPLAGLTAAFVFAAQMVNFPIAAGTSGHLLGGALAAILLGPYAASVVMTVVVVAQALVFADGGVTAVGANVVNVAIVATFGGWAAFVVFGRLFGRSRAGVIAAGGFAGAASVVMAAMAFSLEWLVGATAPVPFDTVFAAMVGVHSLIGIVEGVVTALALSTVLAARPDLIAGIRHDAKLTAQQPSGVRTRTRALTVGAIMLCLVVVMVGAQFASDAPDGLNRVVADQGLGSATESGWSGAVLSDYAVEGISHPAMSLAVAGFAGVAIVAFITFAMFHARRIARS